MNRDAFAAYLEEARGLERDYLEEVARSRRVAWAVAFTSLGLVGVLSGAVLALLPLKRVEPFVVRVDNATGGVDVVTTLRDAQQSYGEAVDKFQLNKYVLSRESYDYETVQATYDDAVLLSSPEVQREFRAIYDGPKARDKVFGDRVRFIVKVRSITLAKSTAVVRFVRTRHTADGAQDGDEPFVATLGYEYIAAPMREEDRLLNPLGFQVTSYRVDPEVVSEGGGT
jgi:type IV secretion system protein VirB8